MARHCSGVHEGAVSHASQAICCSDLFTAAFVDLEAGKPTLRLEHVLRVVDSLGGELTLNGFASNHSGTAPTAANVHDARAARLRALDKLTAQAQELKMGYK